MAGLKPRPSDGDFRCVSGRRASGLKSHSCVRVSPSVVRVNRMTAKKGEARADSRLRRPGLAALPSAASGQAELQSEEKEALRSYVLGV